MAIWRLEVFAGLLRAGEDAWEFEFHSVRRARGLAGFFGVYSEYLSCVHGVEKGMWLPDAVDRLEELGVQIDRSARGVMSHKEAACRRNGLWRGRLVNWLPWYLRPVLLWGGVVRRKVWSW